MFSWVVSGKFHYQNYLKFLHQKNSLDVLYFSHKINNNMGLPKSKIVNLWRKEYILRLLIKILPSQYYERCVSISHAIWRLDLKISFRPSLINVFLLHGASVNAMLMAKATGAIVIGDAVNCHPDELDFRLRSAANSIDIKPPVVVNGKGIKKEISLCDYILAPSRDVFESFVKNGFPAERIKVIPYGINPDDISCSFGGCYEHGLKKKILLVGQVSLRKGHHLLLSAVKRDGFFDDFEVEFYGLCDDEYMAKLKSLNVPFFYGGALSHAEIVKKIASADVLVLPSIEDGFGLVIAEAIENNVPVVVSKYAGASEIVVDGVNGFVVDPFDKEQVFDALYQAGSLKKSDLPRNNIRSWENYADDLNKFLRQIAFEKKNIKIT